MQLKDLFEAIGDLQPGEKKPLEGIKLRDLEAVQYRIDKLRNAVYSSKELQGLFKQDTVLQDKLNQLQDRIALKVRMLQKVAERPTTSMQTMFRTLETECSEFIPIMQQAGKLLYRGTRDDVPQYEGRSREDRSVKDSNAEISAKFDEMLAALGVKALRSNSIYTTTSYGFASSYGHNVYMIFPKNGFNFLSTNDSDLILSNWEPITDFDQVASLYQELDTWGLANVPNWEHTHIHDAIKTKEWRYVFTLIKEHLGWDDNKYNIPDKFIIDPKEYVTPQGVADRFEPNTMDLVGPMKTGYEIMINGEYWALQKRVWEKVIRQRYLSDTYNDY